MSRSVWFDIESTFASEGQVLMQKTGRSESAQTAGLESGQRPGCHVRTAIMLTGLLALAGFVESCGGEHPEKPLLPTLMVTKADERNTAEMLAPIISIGSSGEVFVKGGSKTFVDIASGPGEMTAFLDRVVAMSDDLSRDVLFDLQVTPEAPASALVRVADEILAHEQSSRGFSVFGRSHLAGELTRFELVLHECVDETTSLRVDFFQAGPESEPVVVMDESRFDSGEHAGEALRAIGDTGAHCSILLSVEPEAQCGPLLTFLSYCGNGVEVTFELLESR